MRMMDELKPLFLYSAKKTVYAPIDPNDKRRNATILLLTPNLETSSKLMKLPYVYNPNLFTSFYIDRNVMAYIDNTDVDKLQFDEKEEEAVSEAMINSKFGKVKFRYADNVSFMDKRYIDAVCNNQTVKEIITECRAIRYMPDEIKIFVYPNISALREVLPRKIKDSNQINNIYSFSRMNELHYISEYSYDQDRMRGPYDIYIKAELVACLIRQYKPDIPYVIAKAIGYNLAGLFNWMDKEDDSQMDKDDIIKLGKYIKVMLDADHESIKLARYINTSDLNVLSGYVSSSVINKLRQTLFESDLSYVDRKKMLPGEFGLPEKRKYPMPNEDHVRSAIRFFNYCDKDDEEELAKAIIKRIKRFDMKDINVGDGNRFKKYYHPDDNKKESKSIKESSTIGTDYNDILRICQHLDSNELNRITFYDTYRDSQFVIKRIIKRDAVGTPIGFLDVYQFPSNPEIAQITLAVDNRYRDQGIASQMVKELMNSGIEKDHNFSIYYWTVHPDNDASKALAIKNGFKGGTTQDKYGRYVYTKSIKNDSENDVWKEIPDYLKPTSSIEAVCSNEEAFVTENAAILYEGIFDKVSDKLKRFIYKERLKNNREVLNLYDQIRSMNPSIKKMYIKIAMYGGLNLFVDLSYYNNLFRTNNSFKADNGVNIYFSMINRLINNADIDKIYHTKTIFVPVDPGIWDSDVTADITDYKRSLNPISVFFRLTRTNLGELRRAWGNKNFIFVGSRGYFKVDFSTLEFKDLQRIKINLRKLMSYSEPVVDDFDIDDVSENDGVNLDNISAKNTDTVGARVAKMVDRFEDGSGIKIDKIIPRKKVQAVVKSNHLRLATDSIKIDKRILGKDDSCAIITLDPEGPFGYNNMAASSPILKPEIDTYCMPKE